MRKFIRRVTIHPLFLLSLAWIVLADSSMHLFALLSAVVLHEMGHIFVYRCADISIAEIRLQPFGIGIVPQKQCFISRRVHACCALAGPIANLLGAGICYAFSRYYTLSEFFSVFYLACLFLSIFNLLPIQPLDGCRFLSAVLSAVWGEYVSSWICGIMSVVFGCGLLAFGAYVFIVSKMNLSICVLGCYILACLSVKIYQFIKKRKTNVKP